MAVKKQSGFELLSINDLEHWLKNQTISRTIKRVQQHHTYRPNYDNFDGNNHFTLLKSMKNYHVNNNGWSDMAQHFTTFPDGTIGTGRPLSKSPAGIKGANSGSICIEHIGWFDAGKDQMNAAQRDTIVKMNAILLKYFGLPVNAETIIYHHWYDRVSGKRTGGTGTTKTCPGTAFFGGNKIADAASHFLPLIEIEMQSGNIASVEPLKKRLI